MVKTVTIDGKDRLAIILGEHEGYENLNDMRENLLGLLEAISMSEEAKNDMSSFMLYTTLNLYKLMKV